VYFSFILIFGRDKIEIHVKIEIPADPGSESSAAPILVRRNCKKQARKQKVAGKPTGFRGK